MNDTSPAVEALLRKRLQALSPAERVARATTMFGTAIALARAGIRTMHGNLPEEEMRRHLLNRLYGHEFPPDQLAKIRGALGIQGG